MKAGGTTLTVAEEHELREHRTRCATARQWMVKRLHFAIIVTLLANGCRQAGSSSDFEPTVENRDPTPQAVPEGMVWIPGGEFSMGANDPPEMDDLGMKATTDARPIHRVYVDGFYMDKTDVTNAQ